MSLINLSYTWVLSSLLYTGETCLAAVRRVKAEISTLSKSNSSEYSEPEKCHNQLKIFFYSSQIWLVSICFELSLKHLQIFKHNWIRGDFTTPSKGQSCAQDVNQCLRMNLFFLGYARIILAIISFWFMSTNYIISGWCYIISVSLDSMDGYAARALNQSKLNVSYFLSVWAP